METPLWYYIHEEAEVQVGGRRLGEIGDCIVSDVVFGLVEGDPNSLLSKEPDWKPKLPSRAKDNVTRVTIEGSWARLTPCVVLKGYHFSATPRCGSRFPSPSLRDNPFRLPSR